MEGHVEGHFLRATNRSFSSPLVPSNFIINLLFDACQIGGCINLYDERDAGGAEPRPY
jgi:hypothetical protein